MKEICLTCAALFLGLLTGMAHAAAAGVTSAYTELRYSGCQEISPPDDQGAAGASLLCPGYSGIPVYVAEGDLRMVVSFGSNAEEEPAASQTLPGFNTINEVIEWRLRGGVPFAVIQRWFPLGQDGRQPGSVLIVTQLVPGATCQIAWINARANRKANEMAREAADEMAGGFDCSRPPQIVGRPGDLN
ncbi:hypothetical protein [Roseibium litorale]|uniref:Uncharacterized protein n=1 Tax=Roseibium litorale TaxID=2803841 RepID=A0ABR9CMP7_9HYPH|nr:hypothetical protein [Roseibium litorale]MBD8892145.1 hypothetical protein [Roseibium litorale]